MKTKLPSKIKLDDKETKSQVDNLRLTIVNEDNKQDTTNVFEQ